jgi:UDP-N-acetylmuramoyl-L-alanyl-D-glutamate--2,6-diaminopimelate ligase
MMWNDLLKHLTVRSRGGEGNPAIADVTCDSRTAAKGSLYVSIPGFKVDGDTFIADAAAKGAVAVLSQRPQKNCPVVWAQIDNTRKNLGLLSRLVWGIDCTGTACVGITGTNGKTTTAHLFLTLLSQVHGERDVWMFGTIRYVAAGRTQQAHNTTPEAAEILRAIHEAKKKPRALVMEVSSHSLALDRVAGIEYDAAIFTNLTQDHLDFHSSMEDYYQAKKLLFTQYLKTGGRAVINIDDPYGRRLASELGKTPCVTFGRSETADVRIVSWRCDWSGTSVEIDTAGKLFSFSSRLAGFFNVYNMTALVAGAQALSIGMDTVTACFAATTTVAGRLERVEIAAQFSVFVDYAHTPDALKNVLSTVRELTKGKLLCVFGCGGDRDRKKRPLMAAAVAQNCDEAIVTSDNPRTEKPEAIVAGILAGMPLDFPHLVIIDRREAIRKSLGLARPGDCIVIAGKGHEDYQEIFGARHHFDDKEEVAAAFKELGSHGA